MGPGSLTTWHTQQIVREHEATEEEAGGNVPKGLLVAGALLMHGGDGGGENLHHAWGVPLHMSWPPL